MAITLLYYGAAPALLPDKDVSGMRRLNTSPLAGSLASLPKLVQR